MKRQRKQQIRFVPVGTIVFYKDSVYEKIYSSAQDPKNKSDKPYHLLKNTIDSKTTAKLSDRQSVIPALKLKSSGKEYEPYWDWERTEAKENKYSKNKKHTREKNKK